MALTVVNNLKQQPELKLDFYIQQEWENLVEFVKSQEDKISVEPVDNNYDMMFYGNFYGLLSNAFKIPADYWYITMRVNDLKSPMDYNGFTNVKIINPEFLSNIYESIKQKVNKIKMLNVDT